jgi:Putative phage tail protein
MVYVASAAIAIGVSFVSSQYQKKRAKKAKKKAQEEADKRKGFELVTEGEITNLPVIYGRARVGGSRVYHAVNKRFEYSSPGVGVEEFLSRGGDRGYISTRFQVVVSKQAIDQTVGGNIPPLWQSITEYLVAEILVNDDTSFTLTWNENTGFYTGTVQIGLSDVYRVGQPIVLSHRPLVEIKEGVYTDADDNVFNDIAAISASYVIHSYNNASGFLELYPPAANDEIDPYATMAAAGEPSLASSSNHDNQDFLYVSQVLCVGQISDVHWVYVDDKDYFDPHFGGGHRIHIHTQPGTHEPFMENVQTALPDGKTSTFANFPGVVRAEMVFLINRDDPQYQDIPEVKFCVEGRLIKYALTSANNGAGSTGYSNNAAMVLLDYLLNTDYGQGVDPSKIDFASFREAERVCDEIMEVFDDNNVKIKDIPISGKFWGAKLIDAPTPTRQIKRYEFNGIIDTSKKVRDNIKDIVSVMDQAQFIWSDGKYKINLIYPYVWDASKTYTTGTVVQFYPPGAIQMVNIYRARSFVPAGIDPITASGVLSDAYWELANAAEITDDNLIMDGDISQSWPNLNDRLNHVTIRFTNEDLDFEEDTVSWPPKNSPAGPSYNPVYQTYLAEDKNILLEQEEFINGITDRYHAKAYAEELVRSSRAESNLRLVVSRAYLYLEPGDIIRIVSDELNIPGELLKVSELKVLRSNNIELLCVKFDAENLAWNADDNAVIIPRNIYWNAQLGQARGLAFQPITAGQYDVTNLGSVGRITWAHALGTGTKEYDVKYLVGPAVNVVVGSKWILAAPRTKDLTADLPMLADGMYTFTVIARTTDGRVAPEYDMATGSQWPRLEGRVIGGKLFASNITIINYRWATANIAGQPVKDATLPVGHTGRYDWLARNLSFASWQDPIGVFDTQSTTRPYPDPETAKIVHGNNPLGQLYTTTATFWMDSLITEVIPWSSWVLTSSANTVSTTVTAYYAMQAGGDVPGIPTGGSVTWNPTAALVITAPLGVDPDGGGPAPRQVWTLQRPAQPVGGAIYSSRAEFWREGTSGLNENTPVWNVPTLEAGSTTVVYRKIDIFAGGNGGGFQTNAAGLLGVSEIYDFTDGSRNLVDPFSNNGIVWRLEPGNFIQDLWQATRWIDGESTDNSFAIDWGDGSSPPYRSNVRDLPGTVVEDVSMYQWAHPSTILSAPAVSATYTFATKTLSSPGAATFGWRMSRALAADQELPGFKLWQLHMEIFGAPGTASVTFTWSSVGGNTSVIDVSPNTGGQGPPGEDGTDGYNTRMMYCQMPITDSFVGGVLQTLGTTSFPTGSQVLGAWGLTTTFSATAPAPANGQRVWVSFGTVFIAPSGIYAGQLVTAWSLPIWMSLSVASLSAITATLGTMNSGTILMHTASNYIAAGSTYNASTALQENKNGFTDGKNGFWIGNFTGGYGFEIRSGAPAAGTAARAEGFGTLLSGNFMRYDSNQGKLQVKGLEVLDAANNVVLASGLRWSYNDLKDQPTSSSVRPGYYRGSLASAPTADVQNGDFYFNSTTQTWYTWASFLWVATAQQSRIYAQATDPVTTNPGQVKNGDTWLYTGASLPIYNIYTNQLYVRVSIGTGAGSWVAAADMTATTLTTHLIGSAIFPSTTVIANGAMDSLQIAGYAVTSNTFVGYAGPYYPYSNGATVASSPWQLGPYFTVDWLANSSGWPRNVMIHSNFILNNQSGSDGVIAQQMFTDAAVTQNPSGFSQNSLRHATQTSGSLLALMPAVNTRYVTYYMGHKGWD